MCKISFLLPNLVAFLWYTGSIRLEKWLMRCDTKRAIWWDLYNKHTSIFCIKYMSTIFRTLQVNKWQSKNQTFFSFCERYATKFGTKIWFRWIISCSWSNHTILLLMFVAEKVLLLLVISLTDNVSWQQHLLNLLHNCIFRVITKLLQKYTDFGISVSLNVWTYDYPIGEITDE